MLFLSMQIQDGGDTPLGEPSSGLTLRRLVMWTLEPRAQLRALAFLTHAARKVYGGACVSSIYQVRVNQKCTYEYCE